MEFGRLVLFLGRSKVLFLLSEFEDEESRLTLDVVLTGGVGIESARAIDFIRVKDPVLHLYSPEVLLDSELVLLFSGEAASNISSPLEIELLREAGGVTPGLLFRCSLFGVITVNSSLFRFFRFFMLALCSFVNGDSGWSGGSSTRWGFITSGWSCFLLLILSFMLSEVSQSKAGEGTGILTCSFPRLFASTVCL